MATVLIVDDDPNARLLVTTLLTHGGHEALEAADAREQPWRSRSSVQPDLIITDLSLPEMSGSEFIRALRCGRTHPHDAGRALYGDHDRCCDARLHADLRRGSALPKPAEPRELLAAIEGALGQRQSRISGKSSP